MELVRDGRKRRRRRRARAAELGATVHAPPFDVFDAGLDDLAASLDRVRELGGTAHAGPIDIQMAKIASVADPQGPIFALYDGALEP